VLAEVAATVIGSGPRSGGLTVPSGVGSLRGLVPPRPAEPGAEPDDGPASSDRPNRVRSPTTDRTSAVPVAPGGASAFVRARRSLCGVSQWALEPLRGRVGTAGACWCPVAARAELEPPRALPSFDEVRDAWRRARDLSARRGGRADVWRLSPRDELFAAGAPWSHGAALAELMLREGAQVVLTTRAGLAEAGDLVSLAERHGARLAVRIGLFGASAEVEARWEPGLAPRGERLALAERLAAAGAAVTIELGPIIPFVNDETRQWQGLLRAMTRVGLSRLAPRLVVGDWALIHRLERRLSPAEGRMVMGWLGLSRASRPQAPAPAAAQAADPAEPRGARSAFGLSAAARTARLSQLRAALGVLPVVLEDCRCLTEGVRASACVRLPERAHAFAVQGDLFADLTPR